LSVEVGKYGRIILPKEIRERYGVDEKSRVIIRERVGEIVLIPVARYDRPTEALYGSSRLELQLDRPKEFARQHIRKKLAEEIL